MDLGLQAKAALVAARARANQKTNGINRVAAHVDSPVQAGPHIAAHGVVNYDILSLPGTRGGKVGTTVNVGKRALPAALLSAALAMGMTACGGGDSPVHLAAPPASETLDGAKYGF